MILFWPLFFGAGFFAGVGTILWILGDPDISPPEPQFRPGRRRASSVEDEAEEIAEREFQANGT